MRPAPPSSNRTCGFPASGSPESSRLRYSQVLQIRQSELMQMLVQAYSFRRLKWSLASASQVDTHAMQHVPVDVPVGHAWVSKREVVSPASQMSVYVTHHHRDWLVAHLRPGHLAQDFSLSLQRFLRGRHVQVFLRLSPQVLLIPKCIPQKVQARSRFRQVHQTGLFSIDLQTHPVFQLCLNETHQFFPLITRHYHEVVREAHQSGFCPLDWPTVKMEHLVKPMQVDIRQQGRDYSSLRCSLFRPTALFLPSAGLPFYHLAVQPHPYQGQHTSVTYSHLHRFHQLVVRDAVEVSAQVGIVDRRVPCFQIAPNGRQRLVRRPPRPIPIRTIQKVSLEYRFEYQHGCHLYHPVSHRRDTQRTLLSIGLRDVHSQHRLCLIRLAFQLVLECGDQLLGLTRRFKDVFDTHPVYSWCALVGRYHPPCCFQRISPIDPIIQRVKPILRLLFGLLAQLRPQCGKFLWYGNFPASPPFSFFHQFFRSVTFCVQAVFLTFRLKHTFSKAPSLHRHYPASSLLWASPTPPRNDVPLCLPVSPLSFWRVSQVPRLFFRC